MSESYNYNVNNKPPKVGETHLSKIDHIARIHSPSDSARHIERAQEKEVEVTKGNETGSWQIKEKEEI